MGILDKLKSKMQEASSSPINKAVDESLPSDEQLQDSKRRRRDTANKTTDWLAQKGWPTVGAVAGTAIDLSADMIPETRQEYEEALAGGGTMGTTGKVAKLAMPEAKAAARKLGSEEIKALKPKLEQLNQRWYGLSGEERTALGNDRLKYIKEQLKAEEIVAAEAQSAREALKSEVRSNPSEGPDLSSMYRKSAAKPYEGIGGKVIEKPQAIAEVKASPKASSVKVEEPLVREAKFPTYDGPTVQQLKKLREQEAIAEALRKRK